MRISYWSSDVCSSYLSDPVILAHRSSRPRPCPKISQVCVAGAAPDARRRRRTRLEFVDDATDNSYSSPETCPAIGRRATGPNLGERGMKRLAFGMAVMMGLCLGTGATADAVSSMWIVKARAGAGRIDR